MERFTYVSIVVALLLAGCAPRLAGLPPLIPRQLFFDNPERSNPQISPDGKHLAFSPLIATMCRKFGLEI
jgi:hypothetical protein